MPASAPCRPPFLWMACTGCKKRAADVLHGSTSTPDLRRLLRCCSQPASLHLAHVASALSGQRLACPCQPAQSDPQPGRRSGSAHVHGRTRTTARPHRRVDVVQCRGRTRAHGGCTHPRGPFAPIHPCLSPPPSSPGGERLHTLLRAEQRGLVDCAVVSCRVDAVGRCSRPAGSGAVVRASLGRLLRFPATTKHGHSHARTPQRAEQVCGPRSRGAPGCLHRPALARTRAAC